MADDKTLDLILLKARTHGDFSDKPVSDEVLRAAHDLMKWGPTSANSQPARFVYLRSREAREKLRPALAATNLEKTLKAPVIAIVAYDTRFWEHLPRMFHNPEAINWFKDKGAHTETTAFRNGTLQGAYYLLALRAVGLDCGAMSGFDNAKVDAAFFPDGRFKSNFLVNIGYGTGKGIPPRNARLTFEETSRFA
ncbi:MAG TPA: malonic semialdehyde reductase [Burkholderiales bacterium]|nr:malonic semialdehyde reductase [Burkholderiales bacterium]